MGSEKESRKYRRIVCSDDLVYFNKKIDQTDLYIGAKRVLSKQADDSVKKYRQQIEDYIRVQPVFLHSLVPVKPLIKAPLIIRHMCRAAEAADVGPMAAVAGAVSMYVAQDLMQYSSELIIENGGDIYIAGNKERIVSVYAGNSVLTGKFGIKLKPEELPISICTSSGTVGHSLSFGKADAAVILSRDACLADAVATATGNFVKTADDIEAALNKAKAISGISGALIIIEGNMGVWGNAQLCRIS